MQALTNVLIWPATDPEQPPMCAVFDHNHEQVPELQGGWTPENARQVLDRCDEHTIFTDTRPGAQPA